MKKSHLDRFMERDKQNYPEAAWPEYKRIMYEKGFLLLEDHKRLKSMGGLAK